MLADVSGNGIREIIIQTRTSNNLHVLKTDATSLNVNWPVNLGGTPAVTPSVADIDNDGVVDIVTAISDGTMLLLTPTDRPRQDSPSLRTMSASLTNHLCWLILIVTKC